MARLDYSVRLDRAAEAQSLLGHRIFGEALASLRLRYMDQIAALPVGSDKIIPLHTKLKLIDEFVGELGAVVADAKIDRKPDA